MSYELAEKILFELLKSGVNKSNIKKLIAVLKEAGDRAINRGNINRNFFADLSSGIRVSKRSRQITYEEDYRAFSLQKRNIIIEAFKQSDKKAEQKIADLVEFLFLTGCRLGEAFTLKWVEIKVDWIVFDESYSSEIGITKSTKIDTIGIFRSKGYIRLIGSPPQASQYLIPP